MNFFRKINKNCVPMIWVLAILLVASCSSLTGSQSEPTNVTSLPAETPVVAYGSSLSEWQEATQGDVEPTTDSTASDYPLAIIAEEAVPEEAVAEEAVAEESVVAENVVAENVVAENVVAESDVITTEVAASTIGTPFTLNNIVYQEIMWDGLIPADFRPEAIMEKYQEELDEAEDGSPEAAELYTRMQEEFNGAPVTEVLDETLVRLPGFIAPLNYSDDLITEFLLVPYFGACIHTPAPPANQTVLVQVAEGQGIKPEDSYDPIWVMGKLTTEETTTDLAAAGYYIQEATFEPYIYPQ